MGDNAVSLNVQEVSIESVKTVDFKNQISSNMNIPSDCKLFFSSLAFKSLIMICISTGKIYRHVIYIYI